VPRENVGAIDRRALGVDDPIHVERALERIEGGRRTAVPDAAGTPRQRHDRRAWIDAGAVVADIAARGIAEDDVDLLCIRRPHAEAEHGGRAAWRDVLVGAEAAPARQVIALDLARRAGQPEFAIALVRSRVVNLGRDPPAVAALRPVEDDTPAERAGGVREIERDRGAEHRAAVLADGLLHRQVQQPEVREASACVPTAAQPGVAEDRSLQAGEVLELDSLRRHVAVSPAPLCRQAQPHAGIGVTASSAGPISRTRLDAALYVVSDRDVIPTCGPR
jgi:hypothetical protein